MERNTNRYTIMESSSTNLSAAGNGVTGQPNSSYMNQDEQIILQKQVREIWGIPLI